MNTAPTTSLPQWQTDRLATVPEPGDSCDRARRAGLADDGQTAPQQDTDAFECTIALALRIELRELDSRTRHELATFVARLGGEVRAMHGAGRDSKAVSADRVATLVQDLLTATATH